MGSSWTRSLSPALTSSPSPAIVDPSGRKVWPDPEALRGLASEFVNGTAIADFVRTTAQAEASLVDILGANAVRLEVREVGPARSELTPNSRYFDYAVVRMEDAVRIGSFGRGCRVVLVRRTTKRGDRPSLGG